MTVSRGEARHFLDCRVKKLGLRTVVRDDVLPDPGKRWINREPPPESKLGKDQAERVDVA